MKRLLLIPLVLLIACTTAFSQGKIKNNSYFTLGLNRPIMKYGNLVDYSCSNNLRRFYAEKYGSDLKHYAADLAVGADFYIHPIGWLIEGFKAGLCMDFIDLSADYYRFPDATRTAGGVKSEDTENYNDLTVAYSLNVGVVATISPADKFYIDLKAKLCPTFAVNYFRIPAYQIAVAANSPAFERRNAGYEYGGYTVVDKNGNEVNTNAVGIVNEEDTGIGLGLDYSFGIDIRYSKLMIGCEWVLGNIKYSYDVWDDQKVYNQRFRVKLGLSFE
ncbi:MAG: hypothetical protein J6X43_01970 [Bacteroidales bacterium]|nr:hypothetical protein [Bacteroidales bacterium]MBP5582705.1 hypothetical protein [Bacteroidales bacterium]